MKFLTKFLNNRFFLKNAPAVFQKTYLDINKSKAYRAYCKELHDVDFPCWNTLSLNQKTFIENELSQLDIESLLDIGSGNGELTKYLCKKFECSGVGIDFAQYPTKGKSVIFIKSHFLQSEINQKFSAIISIDSFYMIDNYKKYLKKLVSYLSENGKIIILFSLTMENFNNSKILKALNSLNLKYTLTDFTKDDSFFWDQSLKMLDKFNEDFVNEDQFKLWHIKKKETDKNRQLHKENNINRLALIIQRG